MDTLAIAKICHEANRAYCASIGDHSQVPWNEAPQWQQQSALDGVKFRLKHPDAPTSVQHDAWMADKLAAGWQYGSVKDADEKTHPCLVPYEQLPEQQKFKDALFVAIVTAASN